MDSETIEQMLYERAIRTKIRAPRSERVGGFNRLLTGSVIAVAALIGKFSFSNGSSASAFDRSGSNPQMTDTNHGEGAIIRAPAPSNQQSSDPALASIAMSH
jgi:hypothetical protein